MSSAAQVTTSGLLCLLAGIWAVWLAPEKYRRGWPRTYFVAGSPLIKLSALAAWGLLVIGAGRFVLGLYGLFRSN
jgi:hypothetical protein